HRVPSAISYTVRQLESWLAVTLFERRHRDVVLTPAGQTFVNEARETLKRMSDIRHRCQLVANGWRGQLSIALDNIVRPDRVRHLVADFYRAFPDMELLISMEVFNGVWDALVDGRADVGIGATSAIPVGGSFDYRDMGSMSWHFVVSPDHPVAQGVQPLSDQVLSRYPSICLEDTSRLLPKRTTWLLDNQRRLVVPDWYAATDCLCAGLCVGMMPAHIAKPLLLAGRLIEMQVETPTLDSRCCVAWRSQDHSPAMQWLLDYLGDTETLNREWLSILDTTLETTVSAAGVDTDSVP
ncbi:MAG: DNA-binding transcriptional activator PunR, partial [Plesiomonas sp.]